MATYIDSIQDPNGDELYPKSITKAIYDEATGARLDNMLTEMENSVSEEDFTKTFDALHTVTYNGDMSVIHNYSDGMANGTRYQYMLNCTVNLPSPVGEGLEYLVQGLKISNDYETVEFMSYSPNRPKVIKRKTAGVWQDFEVVAIDGKCNADTLDGRQASEFLLDHTKLSFPYSMNSGTIAYPDLTGRFRPLGLSTGFLKIKLPASISWNTMVSFEVHITKIHSVKMVPTVYYIGGYLYGERNHWYGAWAYSTGVDSAVNDNLPVRFGDDGSNFCVYIGESTTVWDYPIIDVTNIQTAYADGNYNHWETGWSISFTTTNLTTVNKTVENPLMINPNIVGTGKLGGKVQANADASILPDPQLRSIQIGSSDIAVGSGMQTGVIYMVYE